MRVRNRVVLHLDQLDFIFEPALAAEPTEHLSYGKH